MPRRCARRSRRGPSKAAAAKGRPERQMAPILRDDIPTFMEAPLAVATRRARGRRRGGARHPLRGRQAARPRDVCAAAGRAGARGLDLLPQRRRRGPGGDPPPLGLLLAAPRTRLHPRGRPRPGHRRPAARRRLRRRRRRRRPTSSSPSCAPTRSSPTSSPPAPCRSCSAATTPSRSRSCRCSPASSTASSASSPSTRTSTSATSPSTGPARSGREPSTWASSSPTTSCRSASAACASRSATRPSPKSSGTQYFTMADVDELGIEAVAQEALETATSRHRGDVHLARHRRRRPGARRAEVPRSRRAVGARAAARPARPVPGPIAAFDICCLAPRYDLQGHLSQLRRAPPSR